MEYLKKKLITDYLCHPKINTVKQRQELAFVPILFKTQTFLSAF